MKTVITKLSKLLITLCLPLVILVSLLQLYAFNENFYMTEFEKYNISTVTKMSENDLSRVSSRIIFYLKDDAQDLNMKAVIDGKESEVFGEREKLHMIDVKDLFNIGNTIKNIGAVVVTIAIALIFAISQNKKKDIWQALLYSSILPLVLMGILLILMQIDFYKYFTHFHELFFTNDLWLLDPNTDVLIQMLPLEFFMDIAVRIVGWFIGITILIGSVAYINLRKLRV